MLSQDRGKLMGYSQTAPDRPFTSEKKSTFTIHIYPSVFDEMIKPVSGLAERFWLKDLRSYFSSQNLLEMASKEGYIFLITAPIS